MAATHRYRSTLSWYGTTSGGYRTYSREHETIVGEDRLAVSADAAFLGDPARPNPETLLLAAASSCQLLAFLALAARDGIDVRSYTDDAEAVMPVTRGPMRVTDIVLRPQIVLGPGTDRARVAELIDAAHHECYIANTLNAEIVLDPSVTVLGS